MEEDGKRSRAGNAFARARDTLKAAGAGSAERLRRTTQRVAGALGSAAERIRETPAAEKLGAALETRRAIKRAADARERGNLPMAYRLLEAELRERPGEPKLVVAFWEAALASRRPGDAADALLAVIRTLAASEAAEAARLWIELVSALPGARADAGSLVRMVPALLEDEEEEGQEAKWAVLALQHALDPAASGLTPGLAVRVAEYARVLDPPTALRAARIALDAPDLHEARRDALGRLVDELERGGAVEAPAPVPVPPPVAAREPERRVVEATPPLPPPLPSPPRAAPIPAPPVDDPIDDVFSELVIEAALEEHAPALRFQGVKVMTAVPNALDGEALELRVGEERRAHLEYAKIQAIAVAAIGDGEAGCVLIDLALNWNDAGDGMLRVVRLHARDFDAGAVVGGVTESASGLRALLTRLLDRSDALALPDLDAVLGDPPPHFASVAAYERAVLQAESPSDAT